MPTPYTALRDKINEMFPERLKLEFGCEFIDHESTQTMVYLYKENDGAVCAFSKTLGNDCYSDDFRFEDPTSITILGKPLTIVDILRAIGQYGEQDPVLLWMGWIVFENGEGGTQFNLSLPLSAPENASACEKVLKLLD